MTVYDINKNYIKEFLQKNLTFMIGVGVFFLSRR